MLGVVIIVVLLVVVVPVGVLISGGVLSGIIGFFLKRDAEATHEGSELIDTNV
jgi:hypothetical protein